MKRHQIVVTVLVLAVLVHIDWHIGRPTHIHRSLGLSSHWLLGAAAFGWLGWYAGRRGLGGVALVIAATSLLLGHVVEGLGEVLIYGESWSVVMPAIRWRILAEYCVAGAITGVAAFALARRLRTGVVVNS